MRFYNENIATSALAGVVTTFMYLSGAAVVVVRIKVQQDWVQAPELLLGRSQKRVNSDQVVQRVLHGDGDRLCR